MLRIGTRRSPLALAQADEVRRLLAANGTDAELVPMSTSGDEGAAADSSPAGLKGLFVDTILEALATGTIDVAVHSAKDLPAADDDGFVIAAVPRRENPLDVLVAHEAALSHAARIGTSSVRRRAQLLRAFPGFDIVELRGNLDTRLRKVSDGEVDAAVLAVAGLRRLGATPDHLIPLSLDEMVPAPGQGSLALQVRDDDERTTAVLAPLDHRPSHRALDAERSLTWRFGGGCTLPLGALATVEGGRIDLLAVVASPDGSRLARAEVSSDSPEDAAAAAARKLLKLGAEEILEAIDDA